MNSLQDLQDFFGGEIYKDICVIAQTGVGFNAYFPNESDNLIGYCTKNDLIDDIEL
jgi:hypothetical protein